MCFRKIIALSRQIRLCTDSEDGHWRFENEHAFVPLAAAVSFVGLLADLPRRDSTRTSGL
jgi:hypothetical protein